MPDALPPAADATAAALLSPCPHASPKQCADNVRVSCMRGAVASSPSNAVRFATVDSSMLVCLAGTAACGTNCTPAGTCCRSRPAAGLQCAAPLSCPSDGGECACPAGSAACGAACIPAGTCCRSDPASTARCPPSQTCRSDGATCVAGTASRPPPSPPPPAPPPATILEANEDKFRSLEIVLESECPYQVGWCALSRHAGAAKLVPPTERWCHGNQLAQLGRAGEPGGPARQAAAPNARLAVLTTVRLLNPPAPCSRPRPPRCKLLCWTSSTSVLAPAPALRQTAQSSLSR